MRAGELIGGGREADVFVLDDRWVLRRYREDGRDARGEAAVMTHLAGHGYPVPQARPGERAGELVVARLAGPTMLQAFATGAISPVAAGELLGNLLTLLHATPARLAAGPGDRVLHLDLHPENVMLTPQGPMVIDWANSQEGAPGLDWAMSALILAQVAADVAGEFAAGARASLAALLRCSGGAHVPHLDQAGERRSRDPNLSDDERRLIVSAQELIRELTVSPA